MRHVDVAIAGGGLAGATAAAMLGRAGLAVAVVDPHPVYPFDFRSEKLAGEQVHLLRRTGLADAVLPASTAMDDLWIARFGRLVERRNVRGEHYGILYDALVSAMRAAIPASAAFIPAKVIRICAKGVMTMGHPSSSRTRPNSSITAPSRCDTRASASWRRVVPTMPPGS